MYMPIYINGYLVAGNHFVKQEQLHLDKSRKYILVTKRIQSSSISHFLKFTLGTL